MGCRRRCCCCWYVACQVWPRRSQAHAWETRAQLPLLQVPLLQATPAPGGTAAVPPVGLTQRPGGPGQPGRGPLHSAPPRSVLRADGTVLPPQLLLRGVVGWGGGAGLVCGCWLPPSLLWGCRKPQRHAAVQRRRACP